MEQDRVICQMKELAARCHAKRLCLFGSRARGDHRPGSDYDFALWGVPGDMRMKLLAEVDELPSLMKVDVVLISDATDPALLERIQKEGVLLMDKFESKCANYRQALERLREGLARYDQAPGDIVRDGVIQRFEFTCELAWKTVREYLIDQGYEELNSPKAVMRQALSDGLISDGEGWLALLTDRNRTSHIYDEATAEEIFGRVREVYMALMETLLEKMEK